MGVGLGQEEGKDFVGNLSFCDCKVFMLGCAVDV